MRLCGPCCALAPRCQDWDARGAGARVVLCSWKGSSARCLSTGSLAASNQETLSRTLPLAGWQPDSVSGSSCPLGSHLLVPRVQNPRPPLGWGCTTHLSTRKPVVGPWAGLVAPLSLSPVRQPRRWPGASRLPCRVTESSQLKRACPSGSQARPPTLSLYRTLLVLDSNSVVSVFKENGAM